MQRYCAEHQEVRGTIKASVGLDVSQNRFRLRQPLEQTRQDPQVATDHAAGAFDRMAVGIHMWNQEGVQGRCHVGVLTSQEVGPEFACKCFRKQVSGCAQVFHS